jgi:protein-S-isoprenylcysteine O-methyltransferase Ste14
MATQLLTSAMQTAAPQSPAQQLVQRIVLRRVPISVVLFTSIVVLDLLVIHNQPRDILKLSDPFVACSLMAVVMGLLVRSWAAGTLKKQRQLATGGPYSIVRHPLYFGTFLMMIGFGTLIHDPMTLWIIAGPVAWLYWQAIKSEERRMSRLFPAEWPQYTATVARVIPRSFRLTRQSHWSLAQWLRNSEYQAWLGSAIALVGLKVWRLWT